MDHWVQMGLTTFAVIVGLAAVTPTDCRNSKTAMLIILAGVCAGLAR